MTEKRDFGSDGLLALDGDRYFVDDKGDLEVIFKVSSVAVTPGRPHGLKYTPVADFWKEVDKLV